MYPTGLLSSKSSQVRPNAGSERSRRNDARAAGSSNLIFPGSCSARTRIMRSSSASSWRAPSRITSADKLLTALFDQFCDETSPASLMAGADPGPIVAMKVFVEEDKVFPVRIILEDLKSAGDGTAATRIAKEDVDEPAGDFSRHLPEIGFLRGMRRALHLEVLAVVMVKLLQRFDEQIVYGEPDGPAPIRIAAKEARGGFRRLVTDAIHISVHVHFVRMILVVARKRADTIGR